MPNDHALKRILLLVALVLGISASPFAQEAPQRPALWRPSPTGAVIRSMLLPGWGQAYNRNPLKAVIIGGLEEGLIYGVYRQNQLFVDFRRSGEEQIAVSYREDRNRLTWLLAGTLILSMLDAYVDAHLYDFDVSDNLTSGEIGRAGGIVLRLGWINP
jgi:hypothetical protein